MEVIKFEDFLPEKKVLPNLDFRHYYKGYGTFECHCNVKIWFKNGGAFILLTDEKGTSVTNAAATIVEGVYNRYLKPAPKDKCFFTETYDLKEMISFIIPQWDGNEVSSVAWKYMGKIVE